MAESLYEYRKRADLIIQEIAEKLDKMPINQLMKLADEFNSLNIPTPRCIQISVLYSDGSGDWIGEYKSIDSAKMALDRIDLNFEN